MLRAHGPPQVQKQLDSYRALLDQGLITPEGSDRKRRQLLGR